jgi:DNA ligase (NAD+)
LRRSRGVWTPPSCCGISSKTNYVTVGADAGSELDKALSLGIPALTEFDFLRLLKTAE